MIRRPTHPDDPGEAPGQFSGRMVLVLLLLLAMATVVTAVTFIRRPADSPPAAVENRPFGPATRDEVLDEPLIRRGSGGLEPEPMPAPADAADQ